MPKLDVYNLGQHGINRVKSPVQVKDGELLNCQNASVRPVQGQLALTKRDGMSKINTTAAAGTLLAINSIPRKTLGGNSTCVVTPNIPAGGWSTGCWSSELSLFVVLESASSGIITSPDGTTWTSRTSPSAVPWKNVIYAPELDLFVAVGGATLTAAEQVMTSPDGITWTNRTASSDRTWRSVAWSSTLTLLAAIASDGVAAGMVMTSPDGITWTARTASVVRGWRKVVWADTLNLFVAVAETNGVTNQVMTSPDGINWTTRDPGIASGWNDVAWSSDLGRLVAVGSPYVGGGGTAYSMYSSDGINWTAGTLTSSSPSLSEIAWSPELDLFLHAVGSSTSMDYSSNGIDWIRMNSNCSQENIVGVVWSPELEKFLTIGSDPTTNDPIFELVSVS